MKNLLVRMQSIARRQSRIRYRKLAITLHAPLLITVMQQNIT
jgi:hypothetical protein